MAFGIQFKKKHFPTTDSGFTSVNHGSFGMCPQVVIDRMKNVTDEFYSSPDAYLQVGHRERLSKAIKSVAEVLECPHENLAFVPGDSFAVNTVIRSIPFTKGDKIVIPNTTYVACHKTFEYLADTIGIELIVLNFDLPVSHKDVISEFKKTFESTTVKMAFFDTVSSTPSVKFPYLELTQLCKQYNVLSFVDGAHGIGLFPLKFKSSGFEPDFFTSNLHKWLYVPYPFTVLYVDPKYHSSVQTFPITASYVKPENANVKEDFFYRKFAPQSWQYYDGILVVEDAIKFRKEVCGGEDKIFDYCTELAIDVTKLIESKYPGSKVLVDEKKENLCAMISAHAPQEVSLFFTDKDKAQRADFVAFVTKTLVEKYKTFCPVFFWKDKVLFRLSAQIYNELSDYEYALESLKSVIDEYFAASKISELKV